MASSVERENAIIARVAGFAHHLRMNDFPIGPGETQDLVACLVDSDLAGLDETRLRLKILLAGRPDEWARFDDLFEAYWQSRGRLRQGARAETASRRRIPVPAEGLWRDHFPPDNDKGGPEGMGGEQPGDLETRDGTVGRLIASDRTMLRTTDLRRFTDPAEIAEAELLACRLARAMRYRISRRHRRDPKGLRLDFRRTIRANLGHGGEPITLIRKSRPDRPVRIVVFLDVSGSMKAYSRFFLQFVKGLVCEWIDTDAYLFHTKLIRVTDAVRDRNSVKAMTRLSLMADGFGGGTKLGASLRQFNDAYAKRSLNSRTVVVVLSDGYDTGAPAELANQLARLKRRARRLVWLNPLLGWRNYEPVTAAMTAALPFIDHFAAANTLESLSAIEPDLARI